MWKVKLSGVYAYTFQSLIHAQEIDLVPLAAGESIPQYHTALFDQVGLGVPPPAKGGSYPRGWEPSPPTKAAELPVMTAFYPSQYPPAPSPFEPYGELVEITDQPYYLPNTGYYPFSEAGWMHFDGKGKVTGAFRINLAGFSCAAVVVPFEGYYRIHGFGDFPPMALPPGSSASRPVPAGIITTKWSPGPAVVHTWDYSFFVVSEEEIQLMALGRKRHPAVGTGTLKKLHWNEIYEFLRE